MIKPNSYVTHALLLLYYVIVVDMLVLVSSVDPKAKALLENDYLCII